MTDKPQTLEAVALELYRKVVDHECMADNKPTMDREYILSTYVECLTAARGTYSVPSETTETAYRIRKL